MSLDTTTSDPVSEPNEGDILPDSQANEQDVKTEAEQTDEDTSQTDESDESGPEQSDNSEETELKEWAAKKNLPLDDPLKVAKMYRESEKQLGKKGQKEGQLKNAVTEANTLASVDDVQALRNEVTALSFYIQHPEAKALEPEMVSILEDKPWLANDLEVVLDVAKGRQANTNLVAERQTGKKEALAQAEQAGRAAQPRASASNSAKASARITSDNVNQLVGQHMGDVTWYKKHQAEIETALAN